MRLIAFFPVVVILALSGCLGFDQGGEKGIDSVLELCPPGSDTLVYLRMDNIEEFGYLFGDDGEDFDGSLLGSVFDGIGLIFSGSGNESVVLVDGPGASIVPHALSLLDTASEAPMGVEFSERKVDDAVIQSFGNTTFFHVDGRIVLGPEELLQPVLRVSEGGRSCEAEYRNVSGFVGRGDVEAVFKGRVRFGLSAVVNESKTSVSYVIDPHPFEPSFVVDGVKKKMSPDFRIRDITFRSGLIFVDAQVDSERFLASIAENGDFISADSEL